MDFQAIFCSQCGALLEAGKPHEDCAGYPHGTFCSQCGQPKHDYVCAPDPRRAQQQI